MSEVIVYQVRAVDAFGGQRIIHAYETADAAQQAIVMMKKSTGSRYVSVAVPNDPDSFWGVNFPEPPKSKKKK